MSASNLSHDADEFTGKRILITGGIGHNLPQEATQVFV